MKKIVSLIALCGLAACGGGDTTGGKGMPDSGLVSNEVRASNKKITNLPSEVFISNNQDDADITRAASGGLYARGYERYGLDNVKLKKIVEFTPQEFTFLIDDTGRITAINFADQTSVRDGDNNKFSYVITDAGLPEETLESYLTYQTYANRAGLRFADFGVLVAHGANDTPDKITPYIGGYEVKKLNKNDLTANLVFNGVARGRVVSGATDAPLDLNGVGVLTFNAENGAETLNAAFGNWYPMVSVSKNGNDTTLTTFGDYTGDYSLDSNPANENIVYDSDFYGSATGQAEGVVAVEYEQGTQNTADYRHVTMGFGGTTN